MESNKDTPPYTVEIDFDGASMEWRKGKKAIEGGAFQYICGAITQGGDLCKNQPEETRLRESELKSLGQPMRIMGAIKPSLLPRDNLCRIHRRKRKKRN